MPFESLLLKQYCSHRRGCLLSAVLWLIEGLGLSHESQEVPLTHHRVQLQVHPLIWFVRILRSPEYSLHSERSYRLVYVGQFNNVTKCTVLSSEESASREPVNKMCCCTSLR